jgi:hypothetical protein
MVSGQCSSTPVDARVHKLKRLDDAVSDLRFNGIAGDLFNDHSQDDGIGVYIFKLCTGLKKQRVRK